jgi:F-type H+-transporting ATPase subunit epsilon
MSDLISMKIATPFRNEFKGEVSYIEVPTIAGVIGILPGHIPYISALKEGVIKLKVNNKNVLFQIGEGGFLRFNKDVCIITIKSIKPIQKTA